MEDMKDIQWFPGHMAKTRRMIAKSLPLVDAVAELLDARLPQSSRNPEFNRLTGKKPRLVILNKADMADPDITCRWMQYYKNQGYAVITADSKNGKGVKQFAPALRELLEALYALLHILKLLLLGSLDKIGERIALVDVLRHLLLSLRVHNSHLVLKLLSLLLELGLSLDGLGQLGHYLL